MKRFKGKKKAFVIVGAVVAVVAVASAAFAFYLSITGSGSYSSSTLSNQALTAVTFSTNTGGIGAWSGGANNVPGATATITYEVRQNSGSSITAPAGTVIHNVITTSAPATCLAAWYSAPDFTLPTATALPNGSNVVLGTGTITFTNLPTTEQSACKGQSVTDAMTISG